MNRPLTDHEQSILAPLIAKRIEHAQGLANAQTAIDAVVATIFGRHVKDVTSTVVDGRMVLIAPDPVALVPDAEAESA